MKENYYFAKGLFGCWIFRWIHSQLTSRWFLHAAACQDLPHLLVLVQRINKKFWINMRKSDGEFRCPVRSNVSILTNMWLDRTRPKLDMCFIKVGSFLEFKVFSEIWNVYHKVASKEERSLKVSYSHNFVHVKINQDFNVVP